MITGTFNSVKLQEAITRRRLWFRETVAKNVRMHDPRRIRITAPSEVCYCGCCNAPGWLTFRLNCFHVCSKAPRSEENSRAEFVLRLFYCLINNGNTVPECKCVYQCSIHIFQAHSLFRFRMYSSSSSVTTDTNPSLQVNQDRYKKNATRQHIVLGVFR